MKLLESILNDYEVIPEGTVIDVGLADIFEEIDSQISLLSEGKDLDDLMYGIQVVLEATGDPDKVAKHLAKKSPPPLEDRGKASEDDNPLAKYTQADLEFDKKDEPSSKDEGEGKEEGESKGKTGFKDKLSKAWSLAKSHGGAAVKAAAKKYGDAYDGVVDQVSDKLMSKIPGVKKLPKKWQDRLSSALMMVGTGALTGGLGVAALRGGKFAADVAKSDTPFLRPKDGEEINPEQSAAKAEKTKEAVSKAGVEQKSEEQVEKENQSLQAANQKSEKVRSSRSAEEIAASLRASKQKALDMVDKMMTEYEPKFKQLSKGSA